MPKIDYSPSYYNWHPVISKRFWKKSKILYEYKLYTILLNEKNKYNDNFAIKIKDNIIGTLYVSKRKYIVSPNFKIIPKVTSSVIKSEYRRKGWGKKLYFSVLKYYGCLASDFNLHGRYKKISGSVGMWAGYLVNKSIPKIYNSYSCKWIDYSYDKAFKYKSDYKSIVVFKNKKKLTEYIV